MRSKLYGKLRPSGEIDWSLPPGIDTNKPIDWRLPAAKRRDTPEPIERPDQAPPDSAPAPTPVSPQWRSLRWWVRRGLVVILIAIVAFLAFARLDYNRMSAVALAEERAFWRDEDHGANQLTLEERGALMNFIERTERLPRLLPAWYRDQDACSLVVVKWIHLLTGVAFIHAPAWQLRSFTYHPEPTWVSNSRKLTGRWDATDRFNENAEVSDETFAELVDEMTDFSYEEDAIYVLGLRWRETAWAEEIAAADADINSHVALWVRGRVIHFIHRRGSDPLQWETVEEMLAYGDLAPVWIEEVHAKSRTRRADGYRRFVADPMRLPRPDWELPYAQRQMPWWLMNALLPVPSVRNLPSEYRGFFQGLDTVIEKTIFYWMPRWANELYPTIQEEAR